MMHKNAIFAVLLIFAGLLHGCGRSEPGASAKQTEPAAGAEKNSSDPQWVLQNTPRAKVALVFIHGIFGDTLGTWTNANGTSFFSLLQADPKLQGSIDMFAYGFPSRMFKAGSFTIQDAANTLHERMKYNGVLDYDAIVFVAHSMGGLVTLRELLGQRDLLPKVPLVVFYGTPQEGSQITTIARHVASNAALDEMLPADKNSYLQVMNDDWRKIPADMRPPIRCAFEKRETMKIMIVPWSSATRFCDGAAIAIDANHIEMTKPDRAGHDSIMVLVNALNEFVVGRSFAAKLETPDFVEKDGHQEFILTVPGAKQSARLVNAGRSSLRYTLAQLPPSGLTIWPPDTPREIAGQETEHLWFVLGFGAKDASYEFLLKADGHESRKVVVTVPSLQSVADAQLRSVQGSAQALNAWLAQPGQVALLGNAEADDQRVPDQLIEKIRNFLAPETEGMPESLQWVTTAEVLNAINWPSLSARALRRAEMASASVVKIPSVDQLAARIAASTGDGRVFTSVLTPVRPELMSTTPDIRFAEKTIDVAMQLADKLKRVPALKQFGSSLSGDVFKARGDHRGAISQYEDAARVRQTPLVSQRLAEMHGAVAPVAPQAPATPGVIVNPAAIAVQQQLPNHQLQQQKARSDLQRP
jgi:pimeloyl-ACP methyl ester carboxylesterase